MENQLTKKELEKAGQFLFPGEDWKGHLANAMGRHRDTIKRWHRGEFKIDDDAEREIMALVKQHIRNQTKAIEQATKGLK
jgi:hypothetical protein